MIAQQLGAFFGSMIGNALKVVGSAFVIEVMRAATRDTAEVSKPNAEAQKLFTAADDAAAERLRDQISNSAGRDGGDSGRGRER